MLINQVSNVCVSIRRVPAVDVLDRIDLYHLPFIFDLDYKFFQEDVTNNKFLQEILSFVTFQSRVTTHVFIQESKHRHGQFGGKTLNANQKLDY